MKTIRRCTFVEAECVDGAAEDHWRPRAVTVAPKFLSYDRILHKISPDKYLHLPNLDLSSLKFFVDGQQREPAGERGPRRTARPRSIARHAHVLLRGPPGRAVRRNNHRRHQKGTISLPHALYP
jgi:hypothetical protein